MPVNLTANAIAISDGDVNSKELVQVLYIKLTGSTQERYRLLLSDSVECQHATQLNDRVKSGGVRKGSVIQLINRPKSRGGWENDETVQEAALTEATEEAGVGGKIVGGWKLKKKNWSLVYTALAGAVGALYGPLHGGANEAVLKMLSGIGSVGNIPDFIEGVKNSLI